MAAVEANDVGRLELERMKYQTPHEDQELLFHGCELYDDISGSKIDKSMTIKARAVEM